MTKKPKNKVKTRKVGALDVPKDIYDILISFKGTKGTAKNFKSCVDKLKAIGLKKPGDGIQYKVLTRPKDKVVIKLSTHLATRDYNFIKTNRKKYPKNFPVTEKISSWILIQEKTPIDNHLYTANSDKIYELGTQLRISDLHRGNIGWRKTRAKKKEPVFFDVGFHQ